MKLKITALLALLPTVFSQCAFAAESSRTVDQEIVKLTDHVESARKSRQISLKQSLDVKHDEEKVLTKAADLRDDNRGTIKDKDVKTLRHKLFMLDDKVSNFAGQPVQQPVK